MGGKILNEGGQYAKINIQKSTKSYKLTYRIKFPKGFDWGRGGKIPGLGGGAVYTGCSDPTVRQNKDGWSSRIMWFENTEVAGNTPFFFPYIYYENMPEDCGNSFDKRLYIKDNTWYNISMFVKMNTETRSNGVLEIKIGTETLVKRTDMKWASKNFGKEINTLMMGIYRGGNKVNKWATAKDTEILFDNFKLTKG